MKKMGYKSEQLRQVIDNMRKSGDPNNLPGAQPVSFQDTHIDTLQLHQTLVCEKTDGVRYFLIETACNAFFIVDRRYNIKKLFVYNSRTHMA